MRRRLPIRVQSACQEDWAAMRPTGMQDGREGRHCERCASTVVDLTRATRSQAEAIIRSQGGKVCGRVRGNGRGEAVFAPEPVRTGLVPMAVAGLLAACSPETTEEAAPAETALVDGSASGLELASSVSASFGGSMATGVMMPIGPDAPAAPPIAAVSVEPPAIAEEDAVPTPEQRALTRRKHQRQQATFAPIPPHQYDLGMMVMPDAF